MKAATPELINLLEHSGARDFWTTRCVSITTKFRHTLHYTEADVSIVLPETGSVVYRHDGARIKVGYAKRKLGLEVDALDLALAPIDADGTPDPAATPALPVSLYRAARNGLLDRAHVVVRRAFAPMPGPDYQALEPVDPNAGPGQRVLTFTPTGSLWWFEGYLAAGELTESLLSYKINPPTKLLNANFPRHVYRRGCGWDLYGTGCGVSREAFTYRGKMTSLATRNEVVGYTPSDGWGTSIDHPPNGYFDEGVLTVVGGDNAFVRRGIKVHQGGVFTLSTPLPFPPKQDDEFTVVPGCNKTWETCGAKFNNQHHFRGFPNLPKPDSLTGTKMKDVTEKKIRVPEKDPVEA